MGLTSRFILQRNYLIEYKMTQPQNILKKKKSFKRRRFMENIVGVSMTIILVIIQNFNRAQAVPASMGSGYLRLDRNVAILQQQQQQQLWPQRYIRDVASLQQKENLKDSLMQSSSTEVSLEQPQGQCLLDGEYVPETTVFCEKQVGCRAIQKTGHCCPDYKCDCQKDGKTYLNGDKLVDPETPCTVCYCQGGEILCSSVTCFHRDDCTPKYIPGVCCPEYDNCPVATNKTMLTISTTTIKPEIHVAENNPKITIKEITKPIEIRITNDNKAIPIQQMLKPSPTTSTMATAKIATTSTITITSTTTTTTTTTTAATPTILSTQSADVSTTSTIPHANAINNTNSNKIIDHNHQPVKVESFETFSADNNNSQQNKNALPSAGPLQSSVEVEDPVPILSIFSTQGLPEDPSKVNIKREYFITTEGTALAGAASFDTFASNEYANSELIFSQSSAQAQNAFNTAGQQQSSAELDPDTAGSDNIYHIILTTDGPRLTSTSENYLALKGISTTEGLPFDDLSASALNPAESDNKLDTHKNEPTTEGSRKQDSSSESSVIHQHLDEEDSAIPLESNPAYPSLPEDDFSLRDNNFQINDSEDAADEPRNIEPSDAIKSTKHLDEHTYGSGNGIPIDDLAVMSASSSTEGSIELVLPQTTENYDKLKSPEIIQLMYSGEDSSEETRITNNTDFKIEKDFNKLLIRNQHDTSLESLDVGSGSGEIKTANKQKKQREPTTAKPNKKSTAIDIDEIVEASGNGPQDDPKLDAESLKLDETANDTPTNILTSTKNNILTVKLKPVLDKLFHDGMH